jgi:hypothetical protein
VGGGGMLGLVGLECAFRGVGGRIGLGGRVGVVVRVICGGRVGTF